MSNINYLIVKIGGVYDEGDTDKDGYKKRFYRFESEEIEVYMGAELIEKLEAIKR